MIMHPALIQMRFPRWLRPLLAFAFLAFALAGCSATAPDPGFATLRDSAPKAGMARIIVLYPAHFMTHGEVLDVELNGTAFCKLETGSYMVRDVPPGDKVLRFSFCGMRPGSPIRITAEAGKTYYVRAAPYDSSLMGTLSGYPRTTLPYETPHVGLFEVKLLEESKAMEELARMKRAPDQ